MAAARLHSHTIFTAAVETDRGGLVRQLFMSPCVLTVWLASAGVSVAKSLIYNETFIILKQLCVPAARTRPSVAGKSKGAAVELAACKTLATKLGMRMQLFEYRSVR